MQYIDNIYNITISKFANHSLLRLSKRRRRGVYKKNNNNYNNRMERIKNNEINVALQSVHKKMIERGLLTAKDLFHTFALVLVLLLFSTALYAQDNNRYDDRDRHIVFEGTEFSIGSLLDEVERQAEITILNRDIAVSRREVVAANVVSRYFMRDLVDQVLAGTDYIFRWSNIYTVVVIERLDSRGERVFEQVFVDQSTRRIVGINDVFGDAALGTRAGTIEQMLMPQTLGGRMYTYHSSSDFTIITVTGFDRGVEVERQIVVDMATGHVVPVGRLLSPLVRMPGDAGVGYDGEVGRVTLDGAADGVYTFPRDYFPRIAIKTNLLYGATATINLGAEFFLNKWLTLDISAGWNPFIFGYDRKFAHWMIQPTLRYWIQEPFNGFFIGPSLMFADFNVSDIRIPYNWFGLYPRLARGGPGGYRFRGQAYAASLQFGHQWVLSPRWSIEASINAGYMFLDYEVWQGGWCGILLGRETRERWGVTNAGISLIYILR